jgi:hypothetical protein
MSGIGFEVSLDTDLAATVWAEPRPDRGKGHFHLARVVYGPVGEVMAEVRDVQVYLDPMPTGGLLPTLRHQRTWPHELTAIEVAAASWEFKQAVRERRVSSVPHEGLRQAMQYAMRRPLAAGFAFERRRAAFDMSLLNACCFALQAAAIPPPAIF